MIQIRIHSCRFIGTVLILLGLVTSIYASPGYRAFSAEEQDQLRQELLAVGCDTNQVAMLPLNSMRFYPAALRVNLHGRDAAEYYLGFQKSDVIQQVATFLAENDSLLRMQEERYGVPGSIVSAILMIESRLGANWGDYRVPDLLLSLQFLEREAELSVNLDSAVVRERRADGSRSREELRNTLRKRAASRRKWALKEFLAMQRQFPLEQWDRIEGSWAGAMGWPQFLPSSREAYAVDGNGDGRIDLYSKEDAVFSIGNYLRENGWRRNASEDRMRRVIRRYNHSDHYVNAVMRLAADAENHLRTR